MFLLLKRKNKSYIKLDNYDKLYYIMNTHFIINTIQYSKMISNKYSDITDQFLLYYISNICNIITNHFKHIKLN